jgi:hypothetical protein
MKVKGWDAVNVCCCVNAALHNEYEIDQASGCFLKRYHTPQRYRLALHAVVDDDAILFGGREGVCTQLC